MTGASGFQACRFKALRCIVLSVLPFGTQCFSQNQWAKCAVARKNTSDYNLHVASCNHVYNPAIASSKTACQCLRPLHCETWVCNLGTHHMSSYVGSLSWRPRWILCIMSPGAGRYTTGLHCPLWVTPLQGHISRHAANLNPKLEIIAGSGRTDFPRYSLFTNFFLGRTCN